MAELLGLEKRGSHLQPTLHFSCHKARPDKLHIWHKVFPAALINLNRLNRTLHCYVIRLKSTAIPMLYHSADFGDLSHLQSPEMMLDVVLVGGKLCVQQRAPSGQEQSRGLGVQPEPFRCGGQVCTLPLPLCDCNRNALGRKNILFIQSRRLIASIWLIASILFQDDVLTIFRTGLESWNVEQ